MNDNLVEPLYMKAGVSIAELGRLIELIWRDLNGQVDQAKIRQVLVDLQQNIEKRAS
jgi:hypothetical protein